MATFNKNKKAVTLIELIIAIVIIGILAAIAIPMFPRVMEATKAKEAVAALHQIRTGERMYRVEENTYWGPSSGTGDVAKIKQINDKLGVFLDYRTNRNWNYSITAAAANTFTATATRKSGGTQYINKTITIDEKGDLGGDWPF